MTPLPHSATRLAHRVWRLLPRDARRRGLAGASAVLARKPDKHPPARSDGVLVAGEMDSANGLGEAARLLHQAAATLGKARGTLRLGLPGLVARDRPPHAPGAALLAAVNAPWLPAALLGAPRDLLAGRRVIGFWAWELSVAPPSWRDGAKFVHEIWASSAFAAAAFEPLAPGRVRSVPLPLAALDMPVEGERADFDLPDGVFTVTVIFNLASSMERKNPLGAIAAFRAAFGASRDHLLVMKLTGAEAYGQDLARIAEAAAGANVRLITGTWTEPRLRGLIRASDVVLSLHRSEGFGLVPATALLLGRPVVATGWSGNLDFMTDESSALVPYRLVPARDPRGTYDLPGARWAEPDVEAAADWLRRLADDAERRARLGHAGQAHARATLGLEPFAAALAAGGVA
ncbi:glycosyltransferase [Acidomonas methanolica]|uniref:glycosyltransferase n=1 Tax=Acidomonas methanolica TaxID=437 RepID=UPI00211A1956|nr:glycosyltransferase [Acidomonas methanolica]MCQ9154138.1 glycosyltransferase family 4 protein [Acidomonas methanolica]